MGEHLIKPYEISVWEDKLIQDGADYKLKETKLAVIGSDTMTGLNKVYNPVFNKKTNGEKTLTFSLKYKYFDPYSGNADVINPFAALLVNERKVKLFYDNKWYEFIIKEHSESSDELEWTYTCTDAFVSELSKNGYNITFDSELDNNQGTAYELAEKTLENTDWQVGGTDIFKQLIAEPIYKGKLVNTTGITIINVNGTSEDIPTQNSNIYVFYSYIKNKDGKNVQFIIRDKNRKYTIDDKNVITDTNFRITTELTYNEILQQFCDNQKRVIIQLENQLDGEKVNPLENHFQANRLAYNQLTTYDSIMKRTVDKFKVEGSNTEVYRYTDYKYTTSDVVVNYITNGENFNALEDGTLQGWNPYTDQDGKAEVKRLELVTKPELSSDSPLAKLTELSSIEGFLKVQFNGARVIDSTGKIYNTVYNSGIENHLSLIDSIAKGDEFVFRWRAATGTISQLSPTNNLRLIVAKYTQDESSFRYYKHINSKDIILEFDGTPVPSYNYISSGSFQTNQDGTISYVINGVVAVPSTKYIYKSGNIARVWDGTTYVDVNEDTGAYTDSDNVTHIYRPYYYLTATAQQAVSNAELKDRNKKIGIFIYNTVEAGTYFIQDIQLTRYYKDNNNQPVLIGNAPVATSIPIEYYYIKPSRDTKVEDIQTYADLKSLADALNIVESSIKPLYNEQSEKRLSISASKSNCFNILQTIAETFECWVDLVVEHDEQGYIVCDEEDIPQKYVFLREYIGNDNWSGFRYGINLQSIERNVNSDEIVTKLIVDQSQSDLVDEGYISIANAPSNQSEESFILNFDYYYGQGLLNRDEVEEDKNNFIEELAFLNITIKEKESKRRDLENALTKLGSSKNLYSDLLTTAQDTQTRDLDEFQQAAHESYESYCNTHLNKEREKRATEDENLYNLLSELYTCSATINNYSGLLITIEKQYNAVNEELNGSEEKGITGIKEQVDELIEQKTNLINDFENKYRKYILEGTWSSTDYIDPELYYLDALQVSNTSAQPVVSYTINVVEVSQLEGLEDYSFDVGDKSYIEDTEFFGWANKGGILTPAREEVIVSEIEWHLDRPEENIITVQNYKTRFEDLFQRISAAVQTVQYNEATYAKISSLMDANGTINQDVLVASLNNIAGKQYNLTSNGSIIINDDEILIQNLTNSLNRVILNSEGIRVSSDGGNTWTTTINGQGINIGAVYTGLLNTNQVVIGNKNNPSFRWDKSGISAYKTNGNESAYIHCGESETVIVPGTVYYTYNETTSSYEEVLNPTGSPYEQNYFRLDSPYDLQTFVRFDQYGLYGIKNNGSFKAESVEDVKDKAHFAVTWDGFFIRNSYTDGRVEITSDNDFRVIQTLIDNDNIKEDHERIKIGALEFDAYGNPTKYGININQTVYNSETGQYEDIPAFTTGSDGNITITGTINANAGVFDGLVQVGIGDPYIAIDGEQAEIRSSNYAPGGGTGWMIDKEGDAYFMNITARGSIRTAVFEYAEIQAVGGVFLFRPSSAIKGARIDGNNLILKVEKPLLFAKISYSKVDNPSGNPQTQGWYEKTNYGYQLTEDTEIIAEKEYFVKDEITNGSWCKVSNYISDNVPADSTIQNILLTNGLSHVYKVIYVNTATKEVTLQNAASMVTGIDAVTTLKELEGGALIDMGREDGTTNYGIGVNSSDNTVNLPRRAISLFETEIKPNAQNDIRVTYNYRGILGTLPELPVNEVEDSIYNRYMAGTQGIYTDNMYLGDAEQFLTFYTDTSDPRNPKKKLRIRANQVVFEVYNKETGEPTGEYQDINDFDPEGTPGPAGQDAISVVIESNVGNEFIMTNETATLTCTVYQGTEDITSTVTNFLWTKNQANGIPDVTWNTAHENYNLPYVEVTPSEINKKAIFGCRVTLPE